MDDPKQVKLYFAWVGDSQAVLVRDGTAIDVTPPHKPDDDREINRIESLGGIVVKSDCYRVNGLLAVSRAIGDASYKPYITADPEVRVETLKGSEDFMILACDGLWDQVDCDDATQMVYETIQDSNDPVEAAKSVAACLVESAKNQGSADNITVIVVFLRSLRDILPTTSFSDVPKVERINEQKEEGEMLFGLEPVQLRARKEVGNMIPQGNGEDVEGLKVRIAGDSTVDVFKNGIVSSLTPLRREDPQEIIKLPSPTLQSCLADSTVVTETMNSDSTTASSIPSSRCEEEAIPHPLIKSVTTVDSTCPTSTSASSSSCLVTPPNVSENDLLQFSFAPHAGEERQQTIEETSEQIQATDPEEAVLEMETNVRDAFSPSFKTESKNEEIRIEEEFEETTVTTETVFDPVPMSRTTEKIFTAPSSVTTLLHEFSNETRTNGRPPSPSKLQESTRESYSISSPSGNEKVIRVSSGDSRESRESLSRDVFSTNSREVLEQVKETKVFEVDTVINKSPIPESLVRVHQVQIQGDSTPQTSERKEVNHSSMNGSGMTKEILESNVVTSSSEVVSSSFQASSNGFNRAFLECDSSQNLSKDEEMRMKDFSPYDNRKEDSNMNHDYLTLSTSMKGGISPETQVRKVPHDMEAISESIKKLTTTTTKEPPNDLKPLSPTSTGKSPRKRATSPTASSRAKEIPKAKVSSTVGARSKPLATASAKPQMDAKPSPVKTTVSKPLTMTRGTIARTAAGPMSNAAKESVAAKTTITTADRTTARSTATAPKSSLLTTRTATGSVRPASRTSSAPRVASATTTSRPTTAAVKNQVEPRKPVSTVSLLSAKVKPPSSTARAPTKPAPTVARKPSSLLPRSSASTSVLKPVASKVDSGLSSLKTVRLNVSTTSGLRSSSTSALRTAPSLKPAIKKVSVSKPPTRVSPTKPATRVSPTKPATRVSLKTATVKNSVTETKELKSNGTEL